jgi:hypothetical protein
MPNPVEVRSSHLGRVTYKPGLRRALRHPPLSGTTCKQLLCQDPEGCKFNALVGLARSVPTRCVKVTDTRRGRSRLVGLFSLFGKRCGSTTPRAPDNTVPRAVRPRLRRRRRVPKVTLAGFPRTPGNGVMKPVAPLSSRRTRVRPSPARRVPIPCGESRARICGRTVRRGSPLLWFHLRGRWSG